MKTILCLSAALAAALTLGACHKGGDSAGNVADVAADANATASEAISDTDAAESEAAAVPGNDAVADNASTQADH